MQPTTIRIGLPLAVRLYVLVIALAWCAAFGPPAVAALIARNPVAVVPLLALAFGASLGARLLRLSVTAEGEELVVRNVSGNRRLHRDEIRDFEMAGPRTPIPLGRTVQASLHDGAVVVLDVLARPHLLPSSQRRLSVQLDELRGWLAA